MLTIFEKYLDNFVDKRSFRGHFFSSDYFYTIQHHSLIPFNGEPKVQYVPSTFCHTHAQMAKAGHIKYRIFRLVFLSDFFTLLMLIGACHYNAEKLSNIKHMHTRKFRIWHHFSAKAYFLHKKVILILRKKGSTTAESFAFGIIFQLEPIFCIKKIILILRKKGSTTVSNASLAKSMKGKNFMYEPTYTLWWCTKGQLISKCLFGVFNSSKKTEWKQLDLRYHSSFCSFFGRIEDTKETLQN